MSYSIDWKISEIKQDKPVKVFSTFSCGGGSSLGYKRAGFEVIGNVEIDPKMNDLYITNNHPKYNYCEDLREFNKREDLPAELYHLDILDGSPPCTSFSMAGIRAKGWGKAKKFREGQTVQTLDDLFFVFLDTVEKLQPKIVIAENVTGLVKKKARGYVNEIIKRFNSIGYEVQIFVLNAAKMDVPQARERVFFIANKEGFPKLKLKFDNDPIKFGKVRSEQGVEPGEKAKQLKFLLKEIRPGDKSFADVIRRITGKDGSLYGIAVEMDDRVCSTITANGSYIRGYDKMKFSDEDFRRVQSFPVDYNFKEQRAHYVCGMSVPPNMMANVATEIYKQWLKSK